MLIVVATAAAAVGVIGSEPSQVESVRRNDTSMMLHCTFKSNYTEYKQAHVRV
jgi:hypothetical protein